MLQFQAHFKDMENIVILAQLISHRRLNVDTTFCFVWKDIRKVKYLLPDSQNSESVCHACERTDVYFVDMLGCDDCFSGLFKRTVTYCDMLSHSYTAGEQLNCWQEFISVDLLQSHCQSCVSLYNVY